MVLLIVMTALVLAFAAGIVAYTGSHSVMTALAWGGGSFALVVTAGPPLTRMWVHGP
ncbi:hypothetical protein ACIP6V_09510 [Streptomyces sp. NPDC088770]|uniref:hypothetical protein n=1 Tax=Streptomyces sp. NPDC088770 TaxID=3365895 RepID=UPI00381F3640